MRSNMYYCLWFVVTMTSSRPIHTVEGVVNLTTAPFIYSNYFHVFQKADWKTDQELTAVTSKWWSNPTATIPKCAKNSR